MIDPMASVAVSILLSGLAETIACWRAVGNALRGVPWKSQTCDHAGNGTESVPYTILVVAAVCFLFAGCGGAEEGTATVSGVVTLDGKPVEGAAVGFLGREGGRLATEQTDSSGKFTIVAALGKNVVTIAKASANPPPPGDVPMEMPTDAAYQKMVQEQKSEIPARYGDPKTSGLSVEVVEGMPPVEFALSSK